MNERQNLEWWKEKLLRGKLQDIDGIAADILPYRRVLFEMKPEIVYRPAAVLALVYPRDEDVYTAMILRKTYDGVHSGQMAFPGGKKEAEDAGLWETALRETREELGIDTSKVEFVRRLSPVKIPVSGFEVTPFVGIFPETPVFRPDPQEVEKVVEIPWRTLLEKDWETAEKTYRGVSYPIKCLSISNCEIWGATALVIEEIRRMLKDK